MGEQQQQRSQRPTPEQEKQFKQLLNEIGPAAAIHMFSGWLNESVSTGTYGPQYRDTVSGVVSSLRDAEQNLSNIRG